VCDLPRFEESQRRLVVDTLGQATTPALGGQADWAGLPISFEKLRWQISTHYFTVTLELEDALEGVPQVVAIEHAVADEHISALTRWMAV
jgi:hypothetical protein